MVDTPTEGTSTRVLCPIGVVLGRMSGGGVPLMPDGGRRVGDIAHAHKVGPRWWDRPPEHRGVWRGANARQPGDGMESVRVANQLQPRAV